MQEIQRYKALQVMRASKNNTLMWFAAVYFSYLLYGNNIANYRMVYLKMCFSQIFLPLKRKINVTKNSLLLNKELIFRQWNRLSPFLCSAFSVDVVLLSFEIYGYDGLCVSQIIWLSLVFISWLSEDASGITF